MSRPDAHAPPHPSAWLSPDVDRMRGLADQLDRDGDGALAELVRRAADDLAVEWVVTPDVEITPGQ